VEAHRFTICSEPPRVPTKRVLRDPAPRTRRLTACDLRFRNDRTLRPGAAPALEDELKKKSDSHRCVAPRRVRAEEKHHPLPQPSVFRAVFFPTPTETRQQKHVGHWVQILRRRACRALQGPARWAPMLERVPALVGPFAAGGHADRSDHSAHSRRRRRPSRTSGPTGRHWSSWSGRSSRCSRCSWSRRCSWRGWSGRCSWCAGTARSSGSRTVHSLCQRPVARLGVHGARSRRRGLHRRRLE